MTRTSGSEGEGDEGWGNVDVVEGTRHGVLPADSSETKFVLGFKGSEESGERKPPAGGVVAEFGKVLLKG